MNRIFNRRSIDINSLFKFNHLEKDVQSHLKNVYGTLCCGLMAASLGAYLHVIGFLQMSLITLVGTFACFLTILLVDRQFPLRFGCLIGFGLCCGVNLGPLIDVARISNPEILPTAILGTAVIFLSFTFSALYNRSRTYLYMGGLLFSGLNILCLGALLNFFIGSKILMTLDLYLGLAIFSLLILFDTQLIVEKKRAGDDDFIWHSLDLFLDVLNVFRRIVEVLMENKNKNK